MGKRKSVQMSKNTRDMVMLAGNPIWRVFAKQHTVSKRTQTSLGLASRKALYALTNGDGQFEHLKELLVAAHAGIYLAEQGYGTDLMGEFSAALDALRECNARVQRGLGYSLSEDEVREVDELLGLHEQQVQMADRAVLAAAIVDSYRRTASTLSLVQSNST